MKTPESILEPKTILLVDDETGVRATLALFLKSRGHSVLSAASVEDTIALVESCQGPVNLLILDATVGDMKKFELIKRLHVQDPQFKTLFISGYRRERLIHDGEMHARADFLQKPFDLKKLYKKIFEMFQNDACRLEHSGQNRE